MADTLHRLWSKQELAVGLQVLVQNFRTQGDLENADLINTAIKLLGETPSNELVITTERLVELGVKPDNAAELSASLVTKHHKYSEWHDAEVELPDEGRYLVCAISGHGDRYIDVMDFTSGIWWWVEKQYSDDVIGSGRVTHWMELPDMAEVIESAPD